MSRIFLLLLFCLIQFAAYAQLAPGGELMANYTKELKSLELRLKEGKQIEAEKSFQTLLQIQQRHKKKLEGLLANTSEKEEKAEIENRIEEEEERLLRIKELAMDMVANKQELMEEMNGFLEE